MSLAENNLEGAEQTLRSLLSKILSSRNYDKPEVQVKPISTGGGNFTSCLYTITVEETGKKKLNLFAKVGTMGENFRETMENIYIAEAVVYEEIIKKFQQLEEKHNVPEEDRLVFPEFYGCIREVGKETIVLQNMKAEGYEDPDRLKSVDWDQASAAMESLARFHALSFAYRKESPEEFEHYKNTLNTQFGDVLRSFGKQMLDDAIRTVPEKFNSKIKSYFEKNEDMLEELYTFATVDKTVLIHSDYRPSNLVFKRRMDSKVHTVLLDYQTIRAGSPLFDLVYFITLGTDGKFRAQHHDQLLDHYYRELCAAMRRLDVDPNEVYPRKQYDREITIMLPLMILLAVTVLSVVLVDEKEAPAMDGDHDMSKFFKPSELYLQRLTEVLEDLTSWGVL